MPTLFTPAFVRWLNTKAFDESAHPRGQPENAGQFAPSEGASEAVEKARGATNPKADLKISSDTHGYSHGQTDATLTAHTKDGKAAAYLDYSVFEGKPHIKMVESVQKGIGAGERLVDTLAEEYGYENIGWGMMTPDGFKLREKMDKKYGVERVVEEVDVESLVADSGGKVLSNKDGREEGSRRLYVEFDSVEGGNTFADKLREMGGENVDVQEGDGQSWVEGEVVTRRAVVRKKRR